MTPRSMASSAPIAPTPFGAGEEHFVVGQERVALVNAALELVGEGGHAVGEVGWQVFVDAADADVVVHHARAGYGLEELLDSLALPEAVENGRHGAGVESEDAVEEHVVGDAVELAEDRADVPRSLGDLQRHDLLDGHAEGELAVEVADVVDAVEEGDYLGVVLDLAELFGAAVQVADVWLDLDDALAVDPQHHAEDAVRAGDAAAPC